MSSTKWRKICLGLNVFTHSVSLKFKLYNASPGYIGREHGHLYAQKYPSTY